MNTLETLTRWMIRRDAPDVMEITRHCARGWDQEKLYSTLRERNCIGMVIEAKPDKVAGFMVYELHKRALQIRALAVHPIYRRLGYGEQLVGKLKAKLSARRRRFITLAVPETDLGAQLFYREMGFKAARVSRGFYEDPAEDAYLMRFSLPKENS